MMYIVISHGSLVHGWEIFPFLGRKKTQWKPERIHSIWREVWVLLLTVFSPKDLSTLDLGEDHK